MDLLVDPNERHGYSWMRMRIRRIWQRWANAIVNLSKKQDLTGRRQKKVLQSKLIICLNFFTSELCHYFVTFLCNVLCFATSFTRIASKYKFFTLAQYWATTEMFYGHQIFIKEMCWACGWFVIRVSTSIQMYSPQLYQSKSQTNDHAILNFVLKFISILKDQWHDGL